MSVSKPFTYALALEQHGIDFMIDSIGVINPAIKYCAYAAA
jgi:glutaminase